MLKEVIVVMLPTNEKSRKGDLVITPMGLGIHISNEEPSYHNCQNLYILSTDEVKEGEEGTWYYDSNFNKICKWTGESNTYVHRYFKKVIATTEVKLGTSRYNERYRESYFSPLPNPSESFIEKYIKEYNKNNAITAAFVKYKSIPDNEENDEHLEINPNNTISIL